ncbi:hypothetical protein MBLNU459_g0949t1 [Dothideomycetes sp. NU459]
MSDPSPQRRPPSQPRSGLPPDLDLFFEFANADDRPTFVLRSLLLDSSSEASSLPVSAQVVLRNPAIDQLFARSDDDPSFQAWVHELCQSAAGIVDTTKIEKAGTFAGRDWNIKILGHGCAAVFCSHDEPKTGNRRIDAKRTISGSPKSQNISKSRKDVMNNHDIEAPLGELIVDFLQFPLISADPFVSLIRDYDWKETALGPIEDWHPVLRQYFVSTIPCPEPRVLYWGSDMVLLYNEAAVPVMGERHPSCLGHPTVASWGEELVAQITQMIRLGLKQGKPLHTRGMEFILERNGFPEETYHDYTLIPITSTDGYFLGCIAEFFETTEAVCAKARSKVINDARQKATTTNELTDLWTQLLAAVEPSESSDISYAALYRADNTDRITSDDYLAPEVFVRRHSEQVHDVSDRTKQFHYHGSAGASDSAILSKAPYVLAEAFKDSTAQQDVVVLQQGSDALPSELTPEIPGRGVVRSVCLLPITDFDGHCLAFVVIGMNPRRYFDDNVRQFMQTLRDMFSRFAAALCVDEAQKHDTLSPMYRNAPIGMFRSGRDGMPTFVNDTYLELFNVDRARMAEITGFIWNELIAKEDLQTVVLALKTLQTGKSGTWEFRTKDQYNPVGHGERWLEAMAIPELDRDGHVESIHGWITDISHRKLTESLMAQRLKDALDLEKASERFVDTLSHELRNPLSAILQLADGILASVAQKSCNISSEASASIADAAETITLCAQHQHGIVNDILTLSKLDSNLVVLSPEVVQVQPILKMASKMFDVELVKAGIEMNIRNHQSWTDLQLDYVLLDSGRLLQVVINLLTNAIKFTRDSAIRKIDIELAASLTKPTGRDYDTAFISPRMRRGSDTRASLMQKSSSEDENSVYLIFSVQDTGTGLTEEEMSHLFYRFAQASPKTYRQYGGSGLGLFICRELIELHGGQIGLRSEPGVGSTFTFFVEAKRAQAPQVDTPVSDMSDGSMNVEVSIKDMHVLLVEDNAINQKVMKQQLLRAGCSRVHVADHGLDALKLLSTTSFSRSKSRTPLSLILLDVEMPVMDGLTCARRIRKMQECGDICGHVPIIAITANARKEQITSALEAGMDDVVTKPFLLKDLIPRMESLVAKWSTTPG